MYFCSATTCSAGNLVHQKPLTLQTVKLFQQKKHTRFSHQQPFTPEAHCQTARGVYTTSPLNIFKPHYCKPAIFKLQSIYKKVLCTVRHKRLTATTFYIRRPIHQNKTFTPKGFDRPSLKQSDGDESNTVEERDEDFLTFRPYKKDKLKLYPIDDPRSALHLQHTFGCLRKLPLLSTPCSCRPPTAQRASFYC